MFEKYVNLPVVKEAVLLTTDNIAKVHKFINDNEGSATMVEPSGKDSYLNVNTLEGKMKCPVGNYMMRGIKGEYWSIAPDIFKKTYKKYEEVTGEDNENI